MNASDSGEILQTLRRNQQLLALLYEAMIQRFPNLSGLWNRMMTDHKTYATLITVLCEAAGSGSVRLEVDHTALQAATHASDFINLALLRVTLGCDLCEDRALMMAKHLEQSGFTAEFYRLFKPVSRQMRDELGEIEEHVRSHLDSLAHHPYERVEAA